MNGNVSSLAVIIDQKHIFCVPWLLCHEFLLFDFSLKDLEDEIKIQNDLEIHNEMSDDEKEDIADLVRAFSL